MLVNSWLRSVASVTLLGAATVVLAAPVEPASLFAPAPLPDAPGVAAPLTPAPLFLLPDMRPDAQQDATPAKPAPAGSGTPQTTPPADTQAPPTNYDLKRAEHQRILGIMPEFQAVNGGEALRPLTPKEKFHLMWKSSTDPFIFTLDGIVAGIGQAKDSNPGFGQGAEGYFKRFGASYADTFDGNFWGNAVLTVAFKEDPRYFREGEGHSPLHRALYSAGTALWTRRDNGKWGPNYANVLGNFISGGISNIYYPAADRGLGKTVTGAVTVTAEGTIGSELIEFWPDIAHKLFPNHYRRQMQQDAVQPVPATNH